MVLSIFNFFWTWKNFLKFINFEIFQKMPQFFYGMVVIGLLCMVGDGLMWGRRWEGVALGDVGRVLGGCLKGVGMGGHTHILDSCNDKRVSVCHV